MTERNLRGSPRPLAGASMPEGEVRAADGRRIAWAAFGDPAGCPVVYCHGFPGSRLEARLAADSALRLGVRIVGLDRPGYGRSDPAPARRLTDWAHDVARVADHLGARRFPVLGVSGGGPYAAACGWALPERVTAVGIVCGLGPLQGDRGGEPAGDAPPEARAGGQSRPGQGRVHPPGGAGPDARGASLPGMRWPARLGLRVAVARPALSRVVFGLVAAALRADADRLFSLLSRLYPPPDRAVLARPEVRGAILDSFREGVRQGGRPLAEDLALLAGPWGFALKDLRAPVWLWHGEADNTVPAWMGRRVAAAIPGCRSRFVPGEGHFSLPITRMDEILSTLTGSGAGPGGAPTDTGLQR